MRILCVDDDPVARVIYSRGLGEALPEDEIQEAASGEAAVGMLKETVFDTVITDLSMPGMSGIDVLRAVKEHHPDTEVIVVTGKASITTSVEAMRGGARDYIEKPIDIPLLCEKIENIREYLRRAREAEEFRTAKEACEEQAGREVHLLEMRLQKTESTIHSALAVMRSEQAGTEDERLRRAVEILESAS